VVSICANLTFTFCRLRILSNSKTSISGALSLTCSDQSTASKESHE
jgi:hypothetical protein